MAIANESGSGSTVKPPTTLPKVTTVIKNASNITTATPKTATLPSKSLPSPITSTMGPPTPPGYAGSPQSKPAPQITPGKPPTPAFVPQQKPVNQTPSPTTLQGKSDVIYNQALANLKDAKVVLTQNIFSPGLHDSGAKIQDIDKQITDLKGYQDKGYLAKLQSDGTLTVHSPLPEESGQIYMEKSKEQGGILGLKSSAGSFLNMDVVGIKNIVTSGFNIINPLSSDKSKLESIKTIQGEAYRGLASYEPYEQKPERVFTSPLAFSLYSVPIGGALGAIPGTLGKAVSLGVGGFFAVDTGKNVVESVQGGDIRTAQNTLLQAAGTGLIGYGGMKGISALKSKFFDLSNFRVSETYSKLSNIYKNKILPSARLEPYVRTIKADIGEKPDLMGSGYSPTVKDFEMSFKYSKSGRLQQLIAPYKVEPGSVLNKYTMKEPYASYTKLIRETIPGVAKIAKTGYKRFAGLERPVGEAELLGTKKTLGYAETTNPSPLKTQGMKYIRQSIFEPVKGKSWIPKNQYEALKLAFDKGVSRQKTTYQPFVDEATGQRISIDDYVATVGTKRESVRFNMIKEKTPPLKTTLKNQFENFVWDESSISGQKTESGRPLLRKPRTLIKGKLTYEQRQGPATIAEGGYREEAGLIQKLEPVREIPTLLEPRIKFPIASPVIRSVPVFVTSPRQIPQPETEFVLKPPERQRWIKPEIQNAYINDFTNINGNKQSQDTLPRQDFDFRQRREQKQEEDQRQEQDLIFTTINIPKTGTRNFIDYPFMLRGPSKETNPLGGGWGDSSRKRGYKERIWETPEIGIYTKLNHRTTAFTPITIKNKPFKPKSV